MSIEHNSASTMEQSDAQLEDRGAYFVSSEVVYYILMFKLTQECNFLKSRMEINKRPNFRIHH